MDIANRGRQASLRLALSLILVLPAAAAWRFAGPFGGTARAIAIDPQNPSILIAGSRDSLLFRSEDGGVSWRLLPFETGTPGTVNALAIHPSESGHIYAGLDAGNSHDSGVYESKDGGEHWKALPGVAGFRIESMAIWPKDATVMAAGTSKGVFVTRDGGENWQQISRENDPEMQDITALAFDPTDSQILYAGTPHLPWKTADGGATWRSIATGLIDDSDIFSIRVNPERPQLVLASACSGIYRSENGGDSWVKLQGIPGTHRRTHVISEDPRSSDVIFAGTTLGLFKTPDGGKTWRHLTFEQVNWMVFNPGDPHTLYLATEYAGILKSGDSGETFLPVNVGFTNHSLNQITGAGTSVYASSNYEGRFGGVFASIDGGLNWTLRANEEVLSGRNLHSLVTVPSRPEQLFAASADGVLKSSDSGRTWTRLLSQPRIVTPGRPVAERPRINALRAVLSDKLVLLAGTESGLFRSNNSGLSWQPVKSAGIAGVPIVAIYAPGEGASRVAVRTRAGLFLSSDAGTTWQLATLPDEGYYLYDIALPSDSDGPILAATSRGLLRSTDNANHWEQITDGVPASTVESVRFHPERKMEAYLVQFGKVYRSTDGGTSWSIFPSEGLENPAAQRVWFSPGLPDRIFVLSAARGALVFDLAPSVAQVQTVTSSHSQ